MAGKYHTTLVTELKMRCKTRRYGRISTSVAIGVMHQSFSISLSATAIQPAGQPWRGLTLPKGAANWPR